MNFYSGNCQSHMSLVHIMLINAWSMRKIQGWGIQCCQWTGHIGLQGFPQGIKCLLSPSVATRETCTTSVLHRGREDPIRVVFPSYLKLECSYENFRKREWHKLKQLPLIYMETLLSIPRPKPEPLLGFSNTLGCILLQMHSINHDKAQILTGHSSKPGGLLMKCSSQGRSLVGSLSLPLQASLQNQCQILFSLSPFFPKSKNPLEITFG